MGFSILPPATTYDRVWRAQKEPITLIALWDIDDPRIDTEFRCVMEKPEPFILRSTVWGMKWTSPDNMMIIENFSHG